MVIKNVSDSDDTGLYDVKLLNGSRLVADVNCSTDQLAAGRSADADCLWDGKKGDPSVKGCGSRRRR